MLLPPPATTAAISRTLVELQIIRSYGKMITALFQRPQLNKLNSFHQFVESTRRLSVAFGASAREENLSLDDR